MVEKWIPGLRLTAHPGMTALFKSFVLLTTETVRNR